METIGTGDAAMDLTGTEDEAETATEMMATCTEHEVGAGTGEAEAAPTAKESTFTATHLSHTCFDLVRV